MSDAAEKIDPPAEPAKPKARRKPQRRKPAAKVVPFKAPDEFAGMTPSECCSACGPNMCIISGIALCAHPHKGGLQAALWNDPARVARYNRAKKALAHHMLDLRGIE